MLRAGLVSLRIIGDAVQAKKQNETRETKRVRLPTLICGLHDKLRWYQSILHELPHYGTPLSPSNTAQPSTTSSPSSPCLLCSVRKLQHITLNQTCEPYAPPPDGCSSTLSIASVNVCRPSLNFTQPLRPAGKGEKNKIPAMYRGFPPRGNDFRTANIPPGGKPRPIR